MTNAYYQKTPPVARASTRFAVRGTGQPGGRSANRMGPRGSGRGACGHPQTAPPRRPNTVPDQTSPHSRESRLGAAVGCTGTLCQTAQAPPAGGRWVGVASHLAGDPAFGIIPARPDRSPRCQTTLPDQTSPHSRESRLAAAVGGTRTLHQTAQALPAGAHSVGVASHLAGDEDKVGVARWPGAG